MVNVSSILTMSTNNNKFNNMTNIQKFNLLITIVVILALSNHITPFFL